MYDLMSQMIAAERRMKVRTREVLALRGKWARLRFEDVARGATELAWKCLINELRRER